MKKVFYVLAGFLIMGHLAVSGCAKKVETAKDTKGADERVASAPTPAPEQGTKVDAPLVKESGVSTGLNDVYFDFDKSAIRDDAKSALQSSAKWLSSNPKAKIKIEGHCDERGTNEYNIALGEKRAAATKKYLISLGVKADRLSTISYGEEKPQCKEQNEDCWQKNRRAHFTIVSK